MQNIIGQISAGTLGYIHGNTRGAIKAVKAYKKFSENSSMQTPRQTPSSSKPRSVSRGRSMSMSSTVSTNRGTSRARSKSVRRASKRGSVVTNAHAVAKRGSTKVIAKKKKVKISPEFRKKVNEALKAKMLSGVLEHIVYDHQVYSTADAHKKSVEYLGPFSATQIGFSPNHFNAAAAMLWNSKTPGDVWTQSLNSGNNFSTRTFQLYVKNSYMKLEMKNNSTRGMKVQLWTFSPKQRNVSHPLLDIADVLDLEKETTNGTPQNIAGTITETLGLDWRQLPALRKLYKMNCQEFQFEPGEKTTAFIQGPNEQMLDWRKNWQGEEYKEKQNFCVWPIITIVGDLASYKVGADPAVFLGGRSSVEAENSPDDGHGLVIETRYHMSLKCPEQAGLVIPPLTVSGSLTNERTATLNQRSTKYFLQTYPMVEGQASAQQNVDPQNPQQNAAT